MFQNWQKYNIDGDWSEFFDLSLIKELYETFFQLFRVFCEKGNQLIEENSNIIAIFMVILFVLSLVLLWPCMTSTDIYYSFK